MNPSHDPSADPPVRKIGRFEIVEEIGTGSMGVVYLARDPMIGRWVAVKKLTGIKGKDLDPETVRRLLIHEARNVGALEHPGILTVFDIVEDRDGKVEALAMEFVAGQSLRQRLNDAEPMSLKQISEILTAVADALDYAHESGCIHRDVKPANVLLGNDGVIKIADFGIAALRGEDLATELRNLGTPNYLAPERVMGAPGDHRADIYSLGVILYELLTRRLPFEATSIAELVKKIVQEDPAPPELYAPNLMPTFREVLGRALAKEPGDRYQTAGELAAEVRDAVEAQGALNDTVPSPLSLLPKLSAASVKAAPVARPKKPAPTRAPAPAPTPTPAPTPEPTAAEPAEAEQTAQAARLAQVEDSEVLSPVSAVLEQFPVPSASLPEGAEAAMAAMEEVEWESVSVEPASASAPAPAKTGSTAWHNVGIWLARARGAGGAAWRGTRPMVSWIASSMKRVAGAVGKRPALAGLLTVLVLLPLLALAFMGGGDEATAVAEFDGNPLAKARRQVVRLLIEGRELLDAGEAQAAAGKLRQADLLFPVGPDVGKPRMILAAQREVDRLGRVEETSQEAHLAIARSDFASATRSIEHLEELEAPAGTVESAESALAQARRRARRRVRQPTPEPEPPVVAVARPTKATPVVAPKRPQATGPGRLRIDFASARSRGILTVFADNNQILNRPYRFVEKKNFLVRKGVSGAFQESLELPAGVTELKLYLTQPKLPTQHRPLTLEIEAGKSHTLRLRVDDDGALSVGS